MTVGTKKSTVGRLEKDGVSVDTPEGALSTDSTFTIVSVSGVPESDAAYGALVGPVYELKVETGDGVSRFEQPLSVRFAVTDEELAQMGADGDIRIAYYNGTEWEYLTADEVNRDQGYILLSTYHCSWFAKAKPTREELMRQAAHKDAASQAVEVDKLMLRKVFGEGMDALLGDGVSTELKHGIVDGMMNNLGDYGELLAALKNGNGELAAEKSAVIIGQNFFEYLEKQKGAGAAYSGTEILSNLDLFKGGVNGMQKFTNGDYEGAGKELARGIMSTNAVSKLWMTAADETYKQIGRWKTDEIDEAYRIFRDGNDPAFYQFGGYGQIEAGDFDEV